MKKIFLSLLVILSLASCSKDDSNELTIKSSDNTITLAGSKGDFLAYGNSYYYNYKTPQNGGAFDGKYYSYIYINGDLDGTQIELSLDVYADTVGFIRKSNFSETPTGTSTLSYGRLRIHGETIENYYVNAGSIKVEQLTGSLYRVIFDLTLLNSNETLTKTLKGSVIDVLYED
jgi:hypothetical protein